MIYYLMFFVAGVLIDLKDLKNSNKKSDIIFYITAMLIALSLAILHYINPNRTGIAEYIINMFGLGGV
ncbi:MAG: hypothetical protein IJ272_00540 [Clostridia bacterium]|nr:hypothetical protein [Clostridia bacterium]